MSDEDDDWRRRFTEQDVDEEEDYRLRRTTPADRALPQESVEDPTAITVLVDEQGAVSDAVNKAIANRVTSQVEQLDLDAPVERPVFSHRNAPSAGGYPTSPVAESLEVYAKASLKKYRPMAARNEDKKVFSGLL